MPQKIILDTSVIIEHSRTQAGILIDLQKKQSEGNCVLLVPTVVIFEYWSGRSMSNQKVADAAEYIFSTFKTVKLNEKIAKRAGAMLRSGSIHKIDTIIAATALEERAYLATLNTKHFEDIPGLKLFKQLS